MLKDQIMQRLRVAVNDSGIDYEELAYKLNISAKKFYSYMNGKTLPPLVILANICLLLRLDANYILCIKELQTKAANSNK